jgi:Pyridoxamine 5'-phosphate oxidase
VTTPDGRALAVEAYVTALRTGAPSASEHVATFLADDVVLQAGNQEFKGRPAVLKRITGQWPLTPVYVQGAWSPPKPEGDGYSVSGQFSGLGAAPAKVVLTFGFDGEGKINRVQQQTTPAPPPQPTNTIPDQVRGMINGALANGTPICLAYVDETGQPRMSLRGSTQVYSDTQLCIWVRPRSDEGGILKAIQTNPRLGLLYRDSKTRSTLVIQGRGHVETDEAVRRRVYDLAPEVEQNHDPERRGSALIIDVLRLQGGTPVGGVNMAPAE